MRRLLWLVLLVIPFAASAATLTVDAGHGVRTYDTAALLARAELRTLQIPADVAYRRPMRYRAVPLAVLLPGLRADDHIQVVALDGFAAELPARTLLATPGAQPWLAVEDPARPWPALGEGRPSAGPFYLVWAGPHADAVSPEQWPYQVATIRRLDAVAARFPAMRPAASLAADDPVRHGFAVFQSHCLACHTLNGQGDARLGPDLNIPHNPTEYLRADLLRAYIRDPQSLRRWPQARMPGFDRKALPATALDALLAYLRHMAGRKTASDETGK